MNDNRPDAGIGPYQGGREQGIDHEELQCCVVEIRYMFSQKIGIAILEDGDWTDM